MTRRLLEPELELELADEDHVCVRVRPGRYRDQGPELVLVLEDAALIALSRRRVGLRYAEEARRRGVVL